MTDVKRKRSAQGGKAKQAGPGVWTEALDQQLRQLVEKHGPKRWSLISTELKVKSSKQCRRRWKNYLNAERKVGDWTSEEDQLLLEGHEKHGNKWETLARLVGGRTDNAVKNRWAALCKKGVHKSPGSQASPRPAPPPDAGRPPNRRKRQQPQQSSPTSQPSPVARSGMLASRPMPARTALKQRQAAPQRPPRPDAGRQAEARIGSKRLQPHAQEPDAGTAEPKPAQQVTAKRQRTPVQGLSIEIPEQQNDPCAGEGAAQGPVYIRVHKNLLTPSEVRLAADINAMGSGQLHIALEDDPPSSTSGDAPQWTASAPLQSPAYVQMRNFCLHTGLTPRPPGASRSSARALQLPPVSSELNDGHRQLLHKLLWKGKLSCSPSHHKETSGTTAPAADQQQRHQQPQQPLSSKEKQPTAPESMSTAAVPSADRSDSAEQPDGGSASDPAAGWPGQQQQWDVVLSPVFSEDEIDMLLAML